jgi:predicted dehydrogenase
VLIEKPLGGGLAYDADRLLAAAAGPAVAAVAYYRRMAPAWLAVRDLLTGQSEPAEAGRPAATEPGVSGARAAADRPVSTRPPQPGVGHPSGASGQPDSFGSTEPGASRHDGSAGGPVSAQASSGSARPGLGAPVEVRMAFCGVFHPAPADPMYWRTVSAVSGGGVLADAGCHRLDLLCWLFGRPAAVRAELGDRFPGGAERTARLDLSWADGSVARLTCGWQDSGPERDWFRCAGPGVEIELPRLDSGRITGRAGQLRLHRDLPPPPNPLVPMLENFLDCTRTGTAPACPVADAIALDQLIRQAQAGRPG